MSRFIRHEACPKCGSSNNLAVYDDHEYCFGHGCGYTKHYDDGIIKKDKEKLTEEKKKILPVSENPRPLIERGLTKDTVEKYRIGVPEDPDHKIEAVFPKFSPSGEHVANQIRYKEKQFSCEGKISGSCLFGQQEFPSGGKTITITEGFYDTAAAYQLTGGKYPNVGVMSASSAKKEIVDNFEYINSFETVVINFDSDTPGQDAAKEVANLFAPGKVRILSLSQGKDANEYLMKGWNKEYINEWFRAPSYLPDGLKLGSELWDDIKNHKVPYSFPFPWEGLNKKTYGLRLGELNLILADTGVGKTSICKEIEYALLNSQELKDRGEGVGILHLEEPKYDTAIGLMSIYAERPYHLPDVERTEEELKEAFDAVVNTKRLVIWDHFGSNEIDVVLAKIRHMSALGCKYIFIDHLSIIVSDQSGDERKQLDEISTKLKTLIMNLNIACVCVIHINRQGEVRGSAGPEQVSNTVIRLERDKKEINDWRRNITRITVEKCRLTGRTGPAAWLHYDGDRHRITELSPEQVMEYENGGNGAGHEFDSYTASTEKL